MDCAVLDQIPKKQLLHQTQKALEVDDMDEAKEKRRLIQDVWTYFGSW